MPRPTIGPAITVRVPDDTLARIDRAAGEWGMTRAAFVRSNLIDLVTVQAPRYTEGLRRSSTELARIVARHSGWAFDAEDHLVDDDGTLIAFTIEDAAAAMADLNWLVPGGGGVLWSGMPGAERRGARAAELRRGLDSSGRHPGVHGR